MFNRYFIATYTMPNFHFKKSKKHKEFQIFQYVCLEKCKNTRYDILSENEKSRSPVGRLRNF